MKPLPVGPNAFPTQKSKIYTAPLRLQFSACAAVGYFVVTAGHSWLLSWRARYSEAISERREPAEGKWPVTVANFTLIFRHLSLTVRSFWKFISKNWKFSFEEQRTSNGVSISLWTTAHLTDKRLEKTIRKTDKLFNTRKYNSL